jgi:P4 family phage/plasmid primase-like protien
LTTGLGSYYSINERREIVERIRNTATVAREEVNAEDHDDPLLCVNNGVLNLETFALEDHDPKHYFTTGIPVDYDPDADCPKIDGFLSDITEREEDERTMIEMIGNCLLPHYDFESFLVLCGDGANGKTTFFNVVSALLDEDNVVGVDMGALAEGNFTTSDLEGKLANIVPDVSGTKVDDVGPIKSLSGGDSYRAERKYEDAFYFRNRAKLMFGSNRPPVIGERTHAIKRRILPIHLPYRFTDDPDDGNPNKRRRHELVEELTSDEELSGLLNRALEGIERLRANGDFSLPETPDERLERYETFSDPIKLFSGRCLENSDESLVTKDAAYDAYTGFCDAEGFEPKNRGTFFDQLGRTDFSMQSSRRAFDGDRVRCLDNAALLEAGEEYADEQVLDRCREVAAHVYGGGASGQKPKPLVRVTWEDEAANPDAVTVRCTDADAHPSSEKKAFEATVRDRSDQAGVIAWDSDPPDSGHLVGGECYLIERAVFGRDHEGRKQITLDSRTEVTPIQRGVGFTGDADSGGNRTLEEIKADTPDVERFDGNDGDNEGGGGGSSKRKPGGEDEETATQGERRDMIHSNATTAVERDTLTDVLVEDCGLERDAVDHDVDEMLQSGELRRTVDGEIESTGKGTIETF